MIRNNYIAYGLWFLGGLLGLVGLPIGGGLHRIYCGKFISGFAQIALYWLGAFTVWFLVGFVFLLFPLIFQDQDHWLQKQVKAIRRVCMKNIIFYS